MTKKEEREFALLVQDLAQDERCQEMKNFIQHGSITTYEHCLRVARMAFQLNRRLHAGADERVLVAAGFLHDYYLYDWHNHGDHLHGFHHPLIAARNAGRDFDLDEKAKKAIESHMWPLTFLHAPTSREAWLVTLADKICSAEETVMLRKEQRREKLEDAISRVWKENHKDGERTRHGRHHRRKETDGSTADALQP